MSRAGTSVQGSGSPNSPAPGAACASTSSERELLAGHLSKLVNLRADRKPISDARTATYIILSTSSGPGGRWFKSIRPDQLFSLQARKSLTRNRHRAEYKGVSAIACYRPAATFMRFRGRAARLEVNPMGESPIDRAFQWLS